MFSKKKREEKEAAKVRARIKAIDSITRQAEIKAKLVCPICGGKSFSECWAGLHNRGIVTGSLFKKKEFDEHVLPFRCSICETCGFELTFVSFADTPTHYFNSEEDKEDKKDEF